LLELIVLETIRCTLEGEEGHLLVRFSFMVGCIYFILIYWSIVEWLFIGVLLSITFIDFYDPPGGSTKINARHRQQGS
jgi:hypothetical protein